MMTSLLFRSLVLYIPFGCSVAVAGRSIDEHRPASAHGSVELSSVSGHIRIEGWERAEVAVTGTAGDDVERVEVSGDPDHVTVKVLMRSNGAHWGFHDGPQLTVKIPAASNLDATLVSADCDVSSLGGDLRLQSVSGDVAGEVGGDVRASTVSGTLQLSAPHARRMELRSISGDIKFSGGSGEVDLTTVSGDAKAELGSISRAHFKSVSGNIEATLGLGADARIEGESVSGDIVLKFTDAAAAEFDVQAFSGDISNCFGPKPQETRHGAGSRLSFKNGEGQARIHIGTQSGSIKLCKSA